MPLADSLRCGYIICMTTTVTEELLATLDERYKAAKAEIEEIKRIRAAIKAASGEPEKKVRKRSRSPSDGPTFKDMIKVVLTEKGSGAEALEIIDLIKARFGKEIKRTSISPQLSRLKASGDLLLDDKVWLLPQHRKPVTLPEFEDDHRDYLNELEIERREARRDRAREQADML